MKNFSLLTFCFVLYLSGIAKAQIKDISFSIIDQRLNDMVYDSARSKIVISIPSTDKLNGNSLGFIDPYKAQLISHYFIGSEPNCLAITGNYKYIYAGMDGSGSVKKFDLDAHSSIQTFYMGIDTYDGLKAANYISCLPGTDSIIAVSKKCPAISPGFFGVSVYNNGIQLKDTISALEAEIDVIHFYSSSRLLGYNNEVSSFDFTDMSVDTGGVHLTSSVENLFSGFFNEFIIAGNMAVSDNGTAIDLSGPSLELAGTYNLYNPGYSATKVCFDPYLNLVCFALKQFSTDTVYIERFNAKTFLNYDLLRIGGITDDVSKLICWGDSARLAFSTRGGQLVIVNGGSNINGIRDIHGVDARIYPNPVTEKLYIEIPQDINNVNLIITGQDGEQIIADHLNAGKKEIDLTNLKGGVYIITLTGIDFVHTEKIIKE